MLLTVQSEYLASGSASPGVCYFCHAARRPGEVVVDFNLQVDVAVFDGTATDGWLQSCSSCMSEVGRLIGMASADEVTRLRAEVETEVLRRIAAESALDVADKALDAMGVYRSSPRHIRAEDDE